MEQFLERQDDKRRQFSLHLRPSTMERLDVVCGHLELQGLKATRSAVLEAMVLEAFEAVRNEAQ